MAYVSPLTDAHMRENAANALKHLAMFQHVSQRLLADVVRKHGLREVLPLPDKIEFSPKGLAILIVLEGGIKALTATPPRIFDTGAYARRVGSELVILGPGPEFTAVGSDTVRVFVLDVDQIAALPRVVVNALDPHEVVDMNNSL